MKFLLLTLSLIAPIAHAAVPACASNQISLATDSEGGNFDGMSHGGTLLILRNIGPDACSVPGFPVLIFRDAAKATVAITRQVPPGMHPGPVILPAIIAPNAEVTASLRWVSGDVFDHGTCLTPATLSINIGGTELTTAFDYHLCGPTPAKITYESTRLVPDPVYTPRPAASNSVHP
ncbi:DUF4232 domain-containing protein [Granulicella arctica]|uniref:DUF4232 domain-containing protein n=1 Tax=Granulicella arctica TaxID=940613 RepID=UPI0021DF5208|nr:DUF4232 domain-containing protein [Granulicella arctica]